MLRLNDYIELPDAIDQELVEEKLDFILSAYWDSGDTVIIECIYELALRQANNFSLIQENLRSRLSEYILRVWDRDSVENTELCLVVIVNFGLQSAYDEIISVATGLSNVDVRKEIENIKQDVGLNVEDVTIDGRR